MGWRCEPAFFAYFLCGGKESRCRPAQGQRKKHQKQIADATTTTTKPNGNATNPHTNNRPASGLPKNARFIIVSKASYTANQTGWRRAPHHGRTDRPPTPG